MYVTFVCPPSSSPDLHSEYLKIEVQRNRRLFVASKYAIIPPYSSRYCHVFFIVKPTGAILKLTLRVSWFLNNIRSGYIRVVGWPCSKQVPAERHEAKYRKDLSFYGLSWGTFVWDYSGGTRNSRNTHARFGLFRINDVIASWLMETGETGTEIFSRPRD